MQFDAVEYWDSKDFTTTHHVDNVTGKEFDYVEKIEKWHNETILHWFSGKQEYINNNCIVRWIKYAKKEE